jgi:hypothetical protein
MPSQSNIPFLHLACALLLALSGCSRRQGYFYEELSLGSLHVDQAGSWAQGDFRFPTPPTNSGLGFSILEAVQPDAEPKAIMDQFMAAAERLGHGSLRLRLQLFIKGSTNDFFCADFPVDANGNYFIYPRIERSAVRGFFNRIELLPYGKEANLLGDSTVTYHLRKDEEALRERKLIPGVDYTARLTVLAPTPMTNQFKLWVLTYYSAQSNDSQ